MSMKCEVAGKECENIATNTLIDPKKGLNCGSYCDECIDDDYKVVWKSYGYVFEPIIEID